MRRAVLVDAAVGAATPEAIAAAGGKSRRLRVTPSFPPEMAESIAVTAASILDDPTLPARPLGVSIERSPASAVSYPEACVEVGASDGFSASPMARASGEFGAADRVSSAVAPWALEAARQLNGSSIEAVRQPNGSCPTSPTDGAAPRSPHSGVMLYKGSLTSSGSRKEGTLVELRPGRPHGGGPASVGSAGSWRPRGSCVGALSLSEQLSVLAVDTERRPALQSPPPKPLGRLVRANSADAASPEPATRDGYNRPAERAPEQCGSTSASDNGVAARGAPGARPGAGARLRRGPAAAPATNRGGGRAAALAEPATARPALRGCGEPPEAGGPMGRSRRSRCALNRSYTLYLRLDWKLPAFKHHPKFFPRRRRYYQSVFVSNYFLPVVRGASLLGSTDWPLADESQCRSARLSANRC